MKYELSLCPEDRATFGGDEWVVFDYNSLADLMSDVVDEWEQQIIEVCGQTIANLIYHQPLSSGLARRVMVWLARKQADVDTPSLKDFKIRSLKVRIRLVKGGDADPPDQTSTTQRSEVKRSGKRGKS